MRAFALSLPLIALASPALAQQAAPPPSAQAYQLPPEITDMRWADRMTDAMVAMSKAFLNLPVGEVEAAVEGRPATAADKRRTIRNETQMSERDVRNQIEATRPVMRAGMRAVSAALPSMMKGLADAQREMERAMANVPRPDYPKR
ncbi:MAG: hypothetical protein HOP96_12695 [Sphingomonas sp.]|nr:hypothetical protein [Sphingomonas sp.]